MSAISVNSSKQIENYFYTPNVSLLVNNVKYDIDENNILQISVLNNYLENFFPVLHIILYVNHNITYNMKKYRNNISCILTINYKKVRVSSSNDNEHDNSNLFDSFANYNTLLSGNFQVMGIDSNHFMNDTSESEISDISKVDSNDNDPSNLEKMDVYLFLKDDMNSNKELINVILGNAEVMDGIVYSLNNSKIKNALVSQPDNTKVYNDDNNENIIIPPLNLNQTISFLQNSYGIYKLGLTQFLEFGTYYLINKDYTKNLPVAKNDYEKVFINIIDSNKLTEYKMGSYKDTTNECYVVNAEDTTYVENNEEFNKEIHGNKFKIISYDSIDDSVYYDKNKNIFSFNQSFNQYITNQNSDKNSNDKEKILYNNISNNYVESEMINEILENTITIKMSFTNVDVKLFSLNHKFIIQYQDNKKSEFNGIYRLSQFSYGFNKKDFFMMCIFKRIIKLN